MDDAEPHALACRLGCGRRTSHGHEPHTTLEEVNLTQMLPDLSEVPESLFEESIFDSFLAWTRERNITLYPAQEEAALGILTGDNVILATPTGSGKSMVAIAAHFIAMARGQRSFYTAPIKALVSEKFFALCDIFGPESVGMMTGDATVNGKAPIICATAEIVANRSKSSTSRFPSFKREKYCCI